MKRHSPIQLRTKVIILVSMLLLVAVASCSVFITHKPQALWKRIAYITIPPPSAPPASKRFTTLSLEATLPSEKECSARVRRSAWEPRPENSTTNHSVPTPQQISRMEPWGPSIGLDSKADTIRKQITGKFTGTTDEIFQWIACKWGIDEDIIRAEAVTESTWYQSERSDWATDSSLCPPGTWNGTGCYQSYGILQIKYSDNTSVWPMSRDDTAFNAEYTYGSIRACYQGWTSYLYDRTPTPGYPRYHAGDLWGCIGTWYSGSWYDRGAINYIESVKTHLANKEWEQSGF